MDISPNCLVRADHVNKSFGPVIALNDFSIEIMRGEIRGLVGENGSGKSTFSSILAGIQKLDSGEMSFLEKAYHPDNLMDASQQGICMTVQEQGTINGLSVAANIFFGQEHLFQNHGIINIKSMYAAAKKALLDIDVDYIEPYRDVDELTFEDRKLVELARALFYKPKLWIVDETTTALTINGRKILYKQMANVCESGGSVLFISHDIDEIISICDSLTVMRDGVLTANLKKEEFDPQRIRLLMIGRELGSHYYKETEHVFQDEQVALEVRDVTFKNLKNISFSAYQGEILGIGGLSDSGMHLLGRVLFGLEKTEKGKVLKNGEEKVLSASWAVNNNIAYVSKNRDVESLMIFCSIKDNICLPSLKDISRIGPVSNKKQNRLAKKWFEKMEVKASSLQAYCNTLSGGNKQKVVLAKWLAKGADVFILDCPTRGIDVGTKASIYSLIEELQKQGKTIIIISEEMPELIGMSDRIILLKDGQLSGEFFRKDGLTETKLITNII